MALRIAALLALAGSVAAFTAPGAPRPALASARTAGVAMQKLPKGWKKVKSRSRPGEFSYQDTATGKVYSDIPARFGGSFFDDLFLLCVEDVCRCQRCNRHVWLHTPVHTQSSRKGSQVGGTLPIFISM